MGVCVRASARINNFSLVVRRQSIFISHTPSPLTCTTNQYHSAPITFPAFLLRGASAKLSRRSLFSSAAQPEGERKNIRSALGAAELFHMCMRAGKRTDPPPTDNEMDFQRALSALPALYCHNLCVAACRRLFVCHTQNWRRVSLQTFCLFAKYSRKSLSRSNLIGKTNTKHGSFFGTNILYLNCNPFYMKQRCQRLFATKNILCNKQSTVSSNVELLS